MVVDGARSGLDQVRHLHSGAVAGARTLPVHAALEVLFPEGLARASTLRCRGDAALSTAFLLAAAASQASSWVGVAGLASFGVQACAEAGVAVERLVAVRERGTFDDTRWGQVIAALIDGFDIVVVDGAVPLRPGTARRLQARLQHRGAVLLVVDPPGPGAARRDTAFSCDATVTSAAVWHGLGDGHGHLRARRVEVTVAGRRIARARHDGLWFPSRAGTIEPVRTGPATGPAPVVALERAG